ncbi:MAG TPA: ABC transporter substrate-binding protein, partial [Acidimicrobiales bacterium]|nr:ABC transporter substrate-binding protein [Acidimicrobiales bacterium]
MIRSRKSKFLAAGVSCCVLLLAAGCSSGGSSSTGSTGSTSGGTGGSGGAGGSKTYTIGVLTDQTGLAASEFATAVAGVKAGIGAARAQGYHFTYVVGDTGTNPSQALTAAQTMVAQDHVFAVLALSSLTFAAASYLTAQREPVIGGSFDGPEWLKPTSTNMFSVMGNLDYTKVTTTFGEFMKSQGVTNVGTLGYSVSPSSAAAARADAVSAKHAGLKAGYVNDSFPFGSTNVAPVALAMKSAGVDGVAPGVDPNTGFALITALRQDGAHIKVPFLATGYGIDVLNAGAPTIQAAQGSYFLSY